MSNGVPSRSSSAISSDSSTLILLSLSAEENFNFHQISQSKESGDSFNYPVRV